MSQNTDIKVILLPGLDGSGTFFGKSVAYFEGFGDVEVLGLPFSGSQSYSDLADAIFLKLPSGSPYVIVAESFSGPIGIMLASRRPAGLVGLMLVASFTKEPLGLLSAIATKIAVLAKIAPIPPAFVLNWFLMAKHSNGRASRLCQFLASHERKVFAARAISALECDVSDDLADMTVPTLALVAKQDRLVRKGLVAWSDFPNVQAFNIDGPHFLLQDGNERQLRDAIKHFFDLLT